METIYSAICDCQLLYPDPEQSDSSEEEVESVEEIEECPEDFFTSAEGLQHLTAEGEVVLAHLESILHIEDQSTHNGEIAESDFNGKLFTQLFHNLCYIITQVLRPLQALDNLKMQMRTPQIKLIIKL